MEQHLPKTVEKKKIFEKKNRKEYTVLLIGTTVKCIIYDELEKKKRGNGALTKNIFAPSIPLTSIPCKLSALPPLLLPTPPNIPRPSLPGIRPPPPPPRIGPAVPAWGRPPRNFGLWPFLEQQQQPQHQRLHLSGKRMQQGGGAKEEGAMTTKIPMCTTLKTCTRKHTKKKRVKKIVEKFRGGREGG